MSEKREWKGIWFNICQFQGKVKGEVQKSGEYRFITLRSDYTQRDPNGQYVDVEVEIPLMVEPGGPSKAADYLVDGQELYVLCHFKTWEANGSPQYAFAVERMRLGSKPFKKEDAPF